MQKNVIAYISETYFRNVHHNCMIITNMNLDLDSFHIFYSYE